jgi:hypothetical protein
MYELISRQEKIEANQKITMGLLNEAIELLKARGREDIMEPLRQKIMQ